MNTLFLLFFTLGLTKADIPIPDELKNHYRVIVNQYNTSGCSLTPFESPNMVSECQSNGSYLPYCCVTMLRSLNFPGDENSFNICFENDNGTSYFATCEQYYTPSQVETGHIFGYIVLGMAISVILGFIIYCLRKFCCRKRNEYTQF